MIVRVSDSDGTRVNGKWRMLRTFSLVSGMFDAQSDRSLLCDKVNGIINAVFAGQRNIGRAIRDQIDATPCSLNALGIAKRASPPHTSISSDVEITRDVVALNGANDGEEYEGRDLAPISMASAMNLTSSQFMDDNKRSAPTLIVRWPTLSNPRIQPPLVKPQEVRTLAIVPAHAPRRFLN
ncbi:hypothetical protein GN244_ATG08394 [Phytophthora infestans]|uniref:Uncharacterized protein n=1 Tax=Phytophthora infestans TaxID=4787 RepID=A0A833WKK3_PHYIN|nr:hypothetical protein GN244_ATG08394 [Phytophthora infestans]